MSAPDFSLPPSAPGTGDSAPSCEGSPPGTDQDGREPEIQAGRQRVVWRSDQVLVQREIPGPSDLRDDTSAGRLLVKSFVRAQLGLSLMCLMFALAVTASYPVIAAMVPAVTKVTVAGVPLTLIVLGFAFYPVFLAVGWFYNRHARQLEARFTALVDPASRRPDV